MFGGPKTQVVLICSVKKHGIHHWHLFEVVTFDDFRTVEQNSGLIAGWLSRPARFKGTRPEMLMRLLKTI